MLALTSCTGKLGGAVLNAILEYNIFQPRDLVLCTSSNIQDARWDAVKAQGATVRRFNFDEPASMVAALAGCTKLFLVSTPRIAMDYNDAAHGEGREKHHFAAIEAAQKAGVKHVYYTSLAFGSDSKAGVMRAHNRTEAFLYGLKDMKFTVMREGLYNESWPLYFGYYYDLKKDPRKEVVVAGDGLISWTAIKDLGLATALVIAETSGAYDGKTFYLSSSLPPKSLGDIAKIVSEIKGSEVKLKVVSGDEYRRFYVEEKGMDKGHVEWWSSTYEALKDGECDIKDGTLDTLLESRGVEPVPVEETIRKMMSTS